MYIFSDGVYEIQLPTGKIWGLQAFSNLLARNHHCQLKVVMNEIRHLTGTQTFEDDFSLLKIQFE
jgi:phosphoserine phosphatase RsbU/P